MTRFTSDSASVGDQVEIDLITGTDRAQDKIGDSAIPALNVGFYVVQYAIGTIRLANSIPLPLDLLIMH